MKQIHCRYFNGYKPCGKASECHEKCPHLNIPQYHIVVVHLEALGAVLRATSILPSILSKYKNAHITWVTQAPAQKIFENNPLVDRVLTTSGNDLLALKTLHFDVAFCLDKSQKAFGILKNTSYEELFGFKVCERSGAILPANKEALELWNIGLNDEIKFHVNKKTEVQLNLECLALPQFNKNEYVVELNENEIRMAKERRKLWGSHKKMIIGINTGCAPTLPYKKFSDEKLEELISLLSKKHDFSIVLLGGPEDTIRNKRLKKQFPFAFLSPTEKGIRDGFLSIEACDVVISGDSFGMHMAIALKKWVIAWFGPTCDHEIELYGRGVKIKSSLECSPCWNRNCKQQVKCNQVSDMKAIIKAIETFIQNSGKINRFGYKNQIQTDQVRLDKA